MNQSVGVITAIWHYPVKSMQGSAVAAAALTARGVLGDRAWALRDRATGHIASAKHPRKWLPLLSCSARYTAPPQPGQPLPPVWITLPDGARIHSDDPETDATLSRLVGRDVELIAEAPARPTREANRAPIENAAEQEQIMEEPLALAAPAGTFFDHAPLHLLTTATLARFGQLYPAGRFDTRRFRPNLVIECAAERPDFVENGWIGQELRIGTARLAIIDPTPRCLVTTLPQAGLPHDPEILRTVHRHNSAASATVAPGIVLTTVAGVYATVLSAATIAVGDAVALP